MERDRRTVLAASLASLSLACVALAAASMALNGGHLVYALDDPYISLAMARTLVRHAAWGVSEGHHASASTSPLWVILLAPFGALGDGVLLLVPLVINMLAAVWTTVIFVRLPVLRVSDSLVAPVVIAALLPIALFLPGLALIGMEHGLHVAITVWILARMRHAPLADPIARRRTLFTGAIVLSPLLRPEAVYVALGLIVAELIPGSGPSHIPLRVRARHAAMVLACTTAPIVAYAAVNVAHGDYPFPNSLVAKTGLGMQSAGALLLPRLGRLHMIHDDAMLLTIVLGAIALLVFGARDERFSFRRPLIVFLVTWACHLATGRMGAMHRYQTYLVAMGSYAVLGAIGQLAPSARLGATQASLAIALVILPLRKYGIMANMPAAANDIALQPLAIGRFLARYYDGRAVLVRDLGGPAWLHRGLVLDVIGLADSALLRAGRRGDGEFVGAYARSHGVSVIVGYDRDLPLPRPEGWTKVAEWITRPRGAMENVSDQTASFYSPTPAGARALRRQLEAFRISLPARVEVRYGADGQPIAASTSSHCRSAARSGSASE